MSEDVPQDNWYALAGVREELSSRNDMFRQIYKVLPAGPLSQRCLSGPVVCPF